MSSVRTYQKGAGWIVIVPACCHFHRRKEGLQPILLMKFVALFVGIPSVDQIMNLGQIVAEKQNKVVDFFLTVLTKVYVTNGFEHDGKK